LFFVTEKAAIFNSNGHVALIFFLQEYNPGDNALIENLHILLISIEDLYEAGKFNGPEEGFFG